jgi:hypothetical protein
VIGTSEKNGYLRPAVRAAIQDGEEIAIGAGHAEQSILGYMSANQITPLAIATGRPICPTCAGDIFEVYALAASVLR